MIKIEKDYPSLPTVNTGMIFEIPNDLFPDQQSALSSPSDTFRGDLFPMKLSISTRRSLLTHLTMPRVTIHPIF